MPGLTNDRWTVGRNGSKWKRKFRTRRRAEQYVAQLELGRCRKAVHAGDYYIDPPNEKSAV